MQRVGTPFAPATQKELSTTGHLCREPLSRIARHNYSLELLRYIHLNPVRACILSSPEQYRWSSHRVYLGKARSRGCVLNLDCAFSLQKKFVLAHSTNHSSNSA